MKAVRTGHSRWDHHAETRKSGDYVASSAGIGKISPILKQWERETRSDWRKRMDNVVESGRRNWRAMAVVGFAFVLGFSVASGPDSAITNVRLRDRLRAVTSSLALREGELELTRIELTRLNMVMENSKRYHIPADLSAKIYDMALAEGIDPKVAYSLVDVESDFLHNAISPVGALGLTQLMPNTARYFDPTIVRADLFDPETNLRIGFRYLKELIAKYNGDVDLALHAYNRGPAKVDKVVSEGGDPANGYADAVMKGAQAQ
jgi:hypothetical protein